jgi:hypothetical protein
VAELADAQVSEACDGDIVEVQVLSSAPMQIFSMAAGLLSRPAVSAFYMYVTPASNTLEPVKIFVTDFQRPVFSS